MGPVAKLAPPLLGYKPGVKAWCVALGLGLGAVTGLGALALSPMAWAASAPICRACNQPIGPGPYLVDAWQDAYHSEHAAVRRCLFCSRGITAFTDPGAQLPGSQHFACGRCFARGVQSLPAALRLQEDTRRRMARWGVVLPPNLPLRLAPEPELRRLSSRHPGQGATVRGLTERSAWVEQGSGRERRREVRFVMMAGMPPEEFQSVMAHEMMHAWIYLEQQPAHSSALEEGACNLTAYYLLQELGGGEAQRVKADLYRSLDPVYGEGLRRAIRLVQRVQFPGLVEVLRKRGDFPPGA